MEEEQGYMITPKGVLYLKFGDEASQQIVDALKAYMERLSEKEEDDISTAIVIEDDMLVFRLVRKGESDTDFFDENTIIQ